jgi:hypothetical protein
MKSLGMTSVDVNIIGQPLIAFFYIHQILKKKWEYNGTIHQLFIDFEISVYEGSIALSLSLEYPGN